MILRKLKKKFGTSQYAALHGRIEKDFHGHCKWASDSHPDLAIMETVVRTVRVTPLLHAVSQNKKVDCLTSHYLSYSPERQILYIVIAAHKATLA